MTQDEEANHRATQLAVTVIGRDAKLYRAEAIELRKRPRRYRELIAVRATALVRWLRANQSAQTRIANAERDAVAIFAAARIRREIPRFRARLLAYHERLQREQKATP